MSVDVPKVRPPPFHAYLLPGAPFEGKLVFAKHIRAQPLAGLSAE